MTLNEMLARLERSREREREFFSDARHELRTPLTILKSAVQIALRKENPPEALRAALRVAGAETDRLINLAEDLLLIARSDAGALELDGHAVSASAVMAGIERRFRVRARETGRALTVGDGDGLALDVDPTRVEQALSNLVDNALRHGSGAIDVVARASNGHAELHVLDDGPGVPQAAARSRQPAATASRSARSSARYARPDDESAAGPAVPLPPQRREQNDERADRRAARSHLPLSTRRRHA